MCLIPPLDEVKGKKIYSKSDLPDTFKKWDSYVWFDDKEQLSGWVPDNRSRKINCHALMGFSEDPEKFISDMKTDIARTDCGGANEIQYWYKKFQVWKTGRRLCMLYGPCNTSMDNYSMLQWEVMDKLERHLVKSYPQDFPSEIHANGPFPSWMVSLEWGRGGNWSDPKKRVPGENTSHRKVPTFFYELSYEDRIFAVARACKDRGLEKTHFGQSARLQELPATKPRDTDPNIKKDLDDMFIFHGSAQKSLGEVQLQGIMRPDYKVTVELENDDDDQPQQSPGEYSVLDILQRIFIGKPKLFQAILMGNNGSYYAFFSNISDLSVNMASEIWKDVGGWLKIYLLKQRWKFSCIQQLILKSFTPEAADMASKARWCKKTRTVISGYDIRRMEEAKALDAGGIIDRMKGYTTSELEAMKKEEDMIQGRNNVTMPAISAGSFAAFQFGSDMSVQTINPGRKKSANVSVRGGQSYKMGAESQASLFTTDSYGFGDFKDDEDGEGGDEDMKDVEIEMPAGGLEGMETDETAEQNNGSNSSNMSPRNLNERFSKRGDDEDVDDWQPTRMEKEMIEWEANMQKKRDAWEQVRREAREKEEQEEREFEEWRERTKLRREREQAARAIALAREETSLEDSLKKALTLAGGSKEELERKMQEMLATMNVEPPPDSPNPDVESEADEATAAVETSIPANTAHKPPDPSEIRATTAPAPGVEGNEVGQTGYDASSRPG